MYREREREIHVYIAQGVLLDDVRRHQAGLCKAWRITVNVYIDDYYYYC